MCPRAMQSHRPACLPSGMPTGRAGGTALWLAPPTCQCCCCPTPVLERRHNHTGATALLEGAYSSSAGCVWIVMPGGTTKPGGSNAPGGSTMPSRMGQQLRGRSFLYRTPQALQRVRGPRGPQRHCGVWWQPQLRHTVRRPLRPAGGRGGWLMVRGRSARLACAQQRHATAPLVKARTCSKVVVTTARLMPVHQNKAKASPQPS